jgi:hypothetical protein
VVAAVTEETVAAAAGRRQAVPAAAVKQTEGPAGAAAGGRCRTAHAAAAREEADGAPQTADGARGLSGACAAGIPVGAGASPNDVSDASLCGGGGAVGGAGWRRGAEGDGGPLCEDRSNSGSDLSSKGEKEERDMWAHSRKDPALRALLDAVIDEDQKAARNRQPANAIDSVKSSFLQGRKAAPAPADGVFMETAWAPEEALPLQRPPPPAQP